LISHSTLEFTKELGSGVSGTVFKGLFSEQKVAIKVLKSQNKEPTLEEFKKEFHIMSSIQSPYIVHFFGACLEPRICIVMEYCSKGSLYDVLRDEKLEIGWKQALRWGMETCLAVDFLHSFEPTIVHRDLKSLNLLVDSSWTIKLSDFGLARFNMASNMETMGKLRGTYAYLGPELFHGSTYTTKTDVYSIGIILNELAQRVSTGKYSTPYSEYPYIKLDYQIFFHAAEKGLRPTIPASCHPVLATVIKQVLDTNPDNRPTAKNLSDLLKKVFLEESNKS